MSCCMDDITVLLPADVLLVVFNFAGPTELVKISGISKQLSESSDVFWIKARHSLFGYEGSDVPWPFESGEEYFRMLVFQAQDPYKRGDFMRKHSPWPLSSATYQPFNYLMLPPPVDVAAKKDVEPDIQEFRKNFNKLVNMR
eukprot:TRINITY_DN3374_c2_g1_i1.p1 TRINITY_DN3374_c2_g1~~TRINITY_DN3374_c2_g1_i1.p1  ORF type:complete len:142 (+),score=24.82 TRINITY_DN3374_c2_g1_i1:38-463(+)